jgi:hypothetical protein
MEMRVEMSVEIAGLTVLDRQRLIKPYFRVQ